MNYISIRVQAPSSTGDVNVYAVTNENPVKVTNGDYRLQVDTSRNQVSELQQFILPLNAWTVVSINDDEQLVIDKLLSDDRLTDVKTIYFKKITNTHVNEEDNINVTTNDENTSLFNIPSNLMLAAALTDTFDSTFTSSRGKHFEDDIIVRMIRNTMSVSMYPGEDGIIGAYACNLIADTGSINEMPVRSIQYNHMVRLIRNNKFKSNITNGNLLLAYADIYRANVDADTLNINNPCEDVSTIEYDQFTGDVNDNVIRVYTGGKSTIYNDYYAADELDNSFIELLKNGIKKWFADEGVHTGPM